VKALVLDFDGVIADSAGEAFQVALATYTDLCPETRLASEPREALRSAFLELVPLGNRAEDYGVALLALEARVPLPDQPAYDAFFSAQDAGWLQAFHRRFYQVRQAWAERDPVGWRRALPPYRPLLAALRRRAGEARFAIATAKDRRSVRALLLDYGVADLFPEELVLDKEAGVGKDDHLRRLRATLGLEFPELTFVDDKVRHLDRVAPLGVRCALAAWGHNGPREHRLARERGYLVCRLDDVEERIFGAAGLRDGKNRSPVPLRD
jgi:phosphoglycolate phosphatase-like HAD superfamily hydrolase